MTGKDVLVKRLFTDLVGPADENECLSSYPSDVYLTGILFPPKSQISQEEADQLQAEGGTDIDGNDVAQDEVSLATVKRPASAGISFVVEGDDLFEINISIQAGVYEPERNLPANREEENPETDSGNGEEGKPELVWRRIPVTGQLDNVLLNFSSKDFSETETGIEGLGIHIRTSSWDDRLLVTVAMINHHQMPEEYERSSYEQLCFFQTRLSVTCGQNTRFCPRPLGGSAIDEDTRMAKLIYRDVKEYAVGHTCSAEWQESEDTVDCVMSTWIPRTMVRAMSSEGAGEFGPLTDAGILSTEWLATTDKMSLIAGLKRLPELYESWFRIEEGKIDSLDHQYHDQARQHITNAESVKNRMLSSVKLIESDQDVLTAFRLANRAIQIQRSWSSPDEKEALKWRPFQLGFILLSLESLADESHTDRSMADLLWFPTGGGKTEAYLGLIAFTLFYRRLRYGSQGAGVASFMRYTLRLLTVQQFQRASALICACDALRLGKYLPQDVDANFGEIPFSLGLWVGGDTTPNNYRDAKEALGNSLARNRPDVLKYCPHHPDTLLSWKADDASQDVFAHCDNPDCLWHETPLPVWTVDTSVYSHTPSLVIGTIDKFAQIARNKHTPVLFGQSTPYRQPDLIIQDELHLISGPLGTLAGLYEIAIDRLCSNEDVRPKIIASTATIRQASQQIKDLFNRETCLFPPPVLDAGNSGFAVEDKDDPGRAYLGVTTAGRSAKFTLQAVSASLMQTAFSDEVGASIKDDFWTQVIYFNSLRELGGALVLVQDDVGNSILDYAGRRNENPRTIAEPMELTSRVSSSEIKEYLDQLEKKYDQDNSCDVVLASNMISVGVDVPRLGNMIVNGQPKGIAEYIQATSRVGRRRGGPGGFVITVYNNAKSRDRSHYETFLTWHKALYREVEATSVTPFAPRAREKALHAALVIMARHLIQGLTIKARDADGFRNELEEFINEIVDRAQDIDPDESTHVDMELRDFLDIWIGNAGLLKQYWNDKGWNTSLLVSAEKAVEIASRKGVYRGRAVPTPNSMRNVEPGCLYIMEEQLRP